MDQKKLKLVLIEWEDSVLGYQGWKQIDEQEFRVSYFLTVGFLVHEDKKCKVIYPHIKKTEEDIAGAGDIIIPNSAIRKYTILADAISLSCCASLFEPDQMPQPT